MTPDTVLTIGQNALLITLLLAGPPLVAALASGLLVSLFQAVTQINEMTLTFVPKIVAVFLTLALLGPWMLATMLRYTRSLFDLATLAAR